MKQVRETTAGRSISVFVIMRGARHVATVQAHYGSGGRVSVDVWHTDATPLQQSSASGYGYDKFTAALSRLTIDGHAMSDHCETQRKLPKGKRAFPSDYRAPRGYSLANYSTDAGGYTSCYRLSGLEYLRAIGYNVVQGI